MRIFKENDSASGEAEQQHNKKNHQEYLKSKK
jgi:hypothetical protein